mmetsp:Transcript_16132/g.31526  ORF Transcript_16132/g.31526 Transcript_16132/m.31526 type:complete len:225 (-) Transcript_16132:263-937(-)
MRSLAQFLPTHLTSFHSHESIVIVTRKVSLEFENGRQLIVEWMEGLDAKELFFLGSVVLVAACFIEVSLSPSQKDACQKSERLTAVDEDEGKPQSRGSASSRTLQNINKALTLSRPSFKSSGSPRSPKGRYANRVLRNWNMFRRTVHSERNMSEEHKSILHKKLSVWALGPARHASSRLSMWNSFQTATRGLISQTATKRIYTKLTAVNFHGVKHKWERLGSPR